ncbi:DUF998 domain-containing protein [Halogeometricum limi]|uniref:DUF998 domain-containing protein n=1 Tax=Halogeometricum limi TaxID=555875 RepID=A0A1I6G4J7_9EURY|nr:DUF998 domain-containing protein [Halogeometricum limi]SFR37071.1 Protein of unknown function [Halogeometricum limi]
MKDIRLGVRPGIVACLSASMLALAVAPLFVPAGYSWVAHTTSESAAQGVTGAWVARLGFLLFGLAVVRLAVERRSDWGRLAAVFHFGFGLSMVTTATFSTRAWDPAVPFDPVEDAAHSVAATAVGFCFAFGVLAFVYRRWTAGRPVRRLDFSALFATVAVPASMAVFAGYAGVLQRSMFALAYVWYLRECRVHSDDTGGDPAE